MHNLLVNTFLGITKILHKAMPKSGCSMDSTHAPTSDLDTTPIMYVHSIPQAGRLLPSDSQWNSIELNFNLFPKSSNSYESIPSAYAKSVDYDLVITDKALFKRFVYITVLVIAIVIALLLLAMFLPHKHSHAGSSKNLTLAVSRALLFFDAQKSGNYPRNSPIKFRGDSGLQDGSTSNADLRGGFYDSGNNIKFSFPTAYTVTLLSWTVLEYHEKYADIGELDHVMDIIRWGSDYLLKLFVSSNGTSDPILYSQVGGNSSVSTQDNDMSCWQRPEDMSYPRPVLHCDTSASDLAGEIVAGLSAASLVFKDKDANYAGELITAAEKLFELSTAQGSRSQGTYTSNDDCGGGARQFYNSTSFHDDLVWGGTWLFFATGDRTYLSYATSNFTLAQEEEADADKGAFYWNNKLLANAVLFARLLYFRDLGYPYEDTFSSSSDMTNSIMCSYLLDQKITRTPGGLIILKPDKGSPIQYAATASFLSKLYEDYLNLQQRSGFRCGNKALSLKMLHTFSVSQIYYILGDNPMETSYMVGFGHKFPVHVYHRSASIPWDGHPYSCADGDRWLHSKEANPNVLLGAMVAGPDRFDYFLDERDKPWFTEPSISSNAGLVAALIALHDPPRRSATPHSIDLGIDKTGMFDKISTGT